MNSKLAPTLVQQVGDNYILWFSKSNQYVIVENSLYGLIQQYVMSSTKKEFEQSLTQLEFDFRAIDNIYKEIALFLEESNVSREEVVIPELSFSPNHRNLSTYYQVDTVLIEVSYQSEKVKSLIHPQLDHLSVQKKSGDINNIVFDIYIEDDELRLFQNESIIGSYQLKDYHLLQGKFAMLLLCALTNTVETDWLGTFHASTVEKNNQAIMVIGDSGSGKSTFTALLLAHNINVIADDITPILATDKKVYKYPGGISIKSGAFSLLESVIPNFKDLPSFYINPYKGYVKYLPLKSHIDFSKGYSCNTMLCINYQKDKPTSLELMSINEALEILIPESWVAPQQEHAETFLNWIKEVRFYKLTYSDYKEAILKFSELFDT